MTINVMLLAAIYAFNYGGEPAKGLDAAPVVKTVRDDAEAKQVVREWTSPDGRLRLRSTETEYRRFPVTEYVPELVSVGDAPTAIVDDFRSLKLTRPSARTVLRALHGTVNTDRDFAPETPVLGVGKGATNRYEMVATEGRSSAQWMPWWGVDFESGDGLEVGLGWTGAWRADFAADGRALAMSAGMVKTHFRLVKSETIRQPSLLVFRRAKGVTPRQMQTVIHRFMVDVKSPRDRKGELIHGISAITAGGGNKTPAMMKKIIDWKVANRMPFDCFWVDAGWNGPAHLPDLISNCGNMWYHFTGDWRFNPTVHPDGDLGKVADAAHAAGMRMLLWMEPERCVSDPPPPVYREHRDWILPRDDKDIRNKRQLTIDFGNPDALAWVIETVSEHVRRCKLDVFRQDFNLNTLPLWQANDAEDRQGVTEAKHVMGLWKFWDTLRERFPHLVVENCASGGRRLDFEAVSRGHSYCRTDYAIYHREPSQVTDVQNVSLNTLAYLPFQGSESTPAVFFDDYGIFSSFASGNVFTPSDWNAGIVKNDFTPDEVRWLRESFETGRRMMPYYEGDFYPLTDSREAVPLPGAWLVKTSPDETRWCAWQMHRADRDAGFAIFFRRLNTPSHVFTAELGGIDESADYEVETWHGLTERMSGRALRRLKVELRQPRSFRLVFYRKAAPETSAAGVPTVPEGASDGYFVNKDNYLGFCNSNEALLKTKPRGIVLEFPGLGGGSCLGGRQEFGAYTNSWSQFPEATAAAGLVHVYLMPGPWSWMNPGAVREADLVVDALRAKFGLAEDSPLVASGGSMGGLGALVFTAKSRHRVTACAAACPCYDALAHYHCKASFARTYLAAVAPLVGKPLVEGLKEISPNHLLAQMPRIPYFIVCDTADDLFPEKGMDAYVEKLRARASSVAYEKLPGKRHGEFTPDCRARLHAFVCGK